MIHGFWQPSVDVLRGRDFWCVRMELAGVVPEQVDISVKSRVLTIRGERRDRLAIRGFSYQSLEITYSAFERQITLPFDINISCLTWHYQDGMLLIHIQPQS